MLMNLGSKPYISCRIRKDDELLGFVTDLLKKYLNIMSGSLADSGAQQSKSDAKHSDTKHCDAK
jgi:hypothetical protein